MEIPVVGGRLNGENNLFGIEKTAPLERQGPEGLPPGFYEVEPGSICRSNAPPDRISPLSALFHPHRWRGCWAAVLDRGSQSLPFLHKRWVEAFAEVGFLLIPLQAFLRQHIRQLTARNPDVHDGMGIFNQAIQRPVSERQSQRVRPGLGGHDHLSARVLVIVQRTS